MDQISEGENRTLFSKPFIFYRRINSCTGTHFSVTDGVADPEPDLDRRLLLDSGIGSGGLAFRFYKKVSSESKRKS